MQRRVPALEQRIAEIISAYDAQGNHRTGTAVDEASAEWLSKQVYNIGIEAALEPFALSRVDPRSCFLRIDNRRIEGVPLFDAAFTGAEGVRGKLGPLGSDAEIGVGEAIGSQAASAAEARRSRHKAVVLLTRGGRPGLYLLNADLFVDPSGPPILQVSSAESDWLKEHVQHRAEATLVADVGRTTTQAFNVTAKIAGTNPALAPLVLMAPRSGWWQCASEQGSRLVCWLEAMRVLAAGRPVRDVFFVALSGHELGFIGIDSYIQCRAGLIKQAYAWIFFGSDIGAPRQPNIIHAPDDGLQRWIVRAMEREGLGVNAIEPRDAAARAETRPVQQSGGRFVTVACSYSETYHSVADRWPETIDVATLARYANAFATGVLELAEQTSDNSTLRGAGDKS
jgi:hypothetical protein